MSYTINLSNDGKYIILVVKGEINRQIAIPQNQEAHALGKQKGIQRYLVDLTAARNTDTIPDQYDFAYKDMQQAEGIDRLARVAVLVDPGDHSHDFIETVARNSGQDVRIFKNREAAEAYLAD